MIELNNKHIVLIFIIIIVVVFIYNYDVYVIPKNELLCKPIYITKREISPEVRAELNKTESQILKEAFGNLSKTGYIESFGNIEGEKQFNNQCIYDVPPKSFGSFTIPSITNKQKLKVIDSVIKILSYIPTNYCESQIKQLIEYFAIIYETSQDLEIFYKNVANSTKIKEDPYNSKYSHLILFLIGKFDNDYSFITETNALNEKCAMNELIGQIIKNNSEPTNNYDKQIIESEKSKQTKQETRPDYLSEQISTLIDNNSLNPSNVMEIIKKTNNENKSEQNIILPNETQTSNINNKIPNSNNSYPNTNYLDNNYSQEQYSKNYPQVYQPDITKNKEPNIYGLDLPMGQSININSDQNSKCGGVKCSYKCNSSYSNAISYLDSELKPLEGFGNINNNYAPF